ncbi:hypothetical protein JZ751_014481 [Albula glossodonta]|uniref:alanine transaminase n=1 Tax=Albula glossodonta TaxID=121402 RepID=A0A8T2MMM6_9TELE|nr:hypothetical protein JZ751_014481 [Albula glossodonta]
MPDVRRSVAEFISRRDGGVPSLPKNIFISTGSLRALTVVLKLLAHEEGVSQTGVLTPVPTPPNISKVLTRVGVVMVPYHLCEEQRWALQMGELHRALQASRGHCDPRVLYAINPGNPTGHVQSRKSIEEVIRLAAEEKLFLLVNEVTVSLCTVQYLTVWGDWEVNIRDGRVRFHGSYRVDQDSVHGEGGEFVSYKKVLFEMGPQFSDSVQLASLHSISRGIMGEGGLRAGYLELINIEPAVLHFAEMLLCMDISAPVTGQIALDIMVDPPRPGDPSYVKFAEEVLDALPGVSCQPGMGGHYVYPRLHLPIGALEQAKAAGIEVDLLYCWRLQEEAGLCVGPGCVFGQREGTHHIRLCVMVPAEVLAEALARLKVFHLRFMSEFS